jgi:hypothetical protein
LRRTTLRRDWLGWEEVDDEPDTEKGWASGGWRAAGAASEEELAPITAMVSSRRTVLKNLLKRGAIQRDKRLGRLSSVEFGLVACLGRRLAMSVAALSDQPGAGGAGVTQTGRNDPQDNRQVLVRLTRAGLAADDAIVVGARERNQRLLEQLDTAEVAVLLDQIDRLTRKAEQMLVAERELG